MTVYNVLPIVLPIYMSYAPFYASPEEIGLLAAVPTFTSLLLRIPFGILSDKKDKKLILAISLVSGTASFVLFYYSKSILLLVLASIVYGISVSTFIPISLSIISSLYKREEQEKSLGLYTFASAIGVVLGPAILNIFFVFAGVQDSFILSLVIALLGLGAFALGFRDSIKTQRVSQNLNKSLKKILRNSNIMGSSLAYSCSGLTMNAVSTFLPVLLINELGLDPKLSVPLITIRSFFVIITRTLILLNVQNKIGTKRFIIIGLFLHSGIFLIAFGHNFFDMIIPVALSGLGHGILYPTTSYVISKEVNQEEVGLANSYYTLIADGAGFLSCALLGIMAEELGLSLVFVTLGLISVVGVFASFVLVRI